jgi:hypothetical protein
MAVAYDAGTTDKITVTTPLATAPGFACTYYMWAKRTAANATNTRGTTLGEGTAGACDLFLYLTTTSAYGCLFARVTTSSEKQTTTEIMPLNTWVFIATTYSEGSGARMFHGGLTSLIVEPTYSVNIAGSGDTVTANANTIVNNRGAASTRSMPLEIAYSALYNREMTQQELISHQFNPRVESGCKFFYNAHATGTITDLSGNLKNGTGTGLALANHVPLGMGY